MPKIRIPFADKLNNRNNLNTYDYLLLNAFVEHNTTGIDVIKRPGWLKKLTTSSIVSTGRGFTYSSPHSLFYAVIGDALFSIDTTLTTVTELVRKTITSASWAGGVATYACVGHGFTATTQSVKISGILGTGYNGVFTVLGTPTADTFTVNIAVDPVYVSVTNAKASPILTETGKVYFEQTRNGNNQVTMLQIPKSSAQPSQLFMIASSGVVTRVTDVDLPIDLIGAPVSIDRYLFTLSSARFEIYNMDLETPTSINSLGFVTADTYADSAITLAKTHNQVVCFKEYSTEFFYDSAIAAPASPLSKIPQQTLTIGCASAASVVTIGNNIVWLSRNQNGGLAVHMMTGGYAQKISSIPIDRILSSMEAFVFSDKVESCYLSIEGHEIYLLTIEGNIGTNQAIPDIAIPDIAIPDIGSGLNTYTRTLAYDITENEWAEWSSLSSSQQSSFFGTYSVSGPHISSVQDYTNTLIMEKSTGDIYEMSPAPVGASYFPTYKDGTRAITVKVVTNGNDGGTSNKKKNNSLEILSDRYTTSNPLSIRYTDDDYQTWSTTRTVDLSTRPKLNNLGMFQNTRSFEFTHESDMPLRIRGYDLDVEKMNN